MKDSTHRLYPLRYSVQLDKIVIEDNTFDGNEVGHKGSAIYSRQMTNLLIKGNTIARSQPAYSFRPTAKEFSYFKYLSKELRPTLFTQPTFYANVKDELDFASISVKEGRLSKADNFGNPDEEKRKIIDLPQVQGAVYVETCPAACLV